VKKRLFNVIVIDPVADEIQEAVDYYKGKQESLGAQFFSAAKKTLQSLENDALLYQEKYKDVRCIKVKKFPYLIHFKVNEKSNTVYIYALICTHKNPDENWVE
jgi:hypothetical protein